MTTEYYVTFVAYDTETKQQATHTIEPVEDGVLRLYPDLREVWNVLDLRLGEANATSNKDKTKRSRPKASSVKSGNRKSPR